MEQITLLELYTRFEDMPPGMFLVLPRNRINNAPRDFYLLQRGCVDKRSHLDWLVYEMKENPNNLLQLHRSSDTITARHEVTGWVTCAACGLRLENHISEAQTDEIVKTILTTR